MQLCGELQSGWTANRNHPGGGQEFNHCDKCGRGRVPSVPLRMRHTHWLNSRLSSLNSWPSLFYFYFTLSLLFCLVFITLCFLCSFVTFTLLILFYLSYYFLSDLSHSVLIAGCQFAQILVHPLAAATWTDMSISKRVSVPTLHTVCLENVRKS
jgi:hypothetical protein